MSQEAELKAPCKGAQKKVEALGAKFLKEEAQLDTYYSHPCRNFRDSDEALRIRKTSDTRITYKGPKTGSGLKVRREIEFPVPGEAQELLESIGFKKAFTIKKTRRTYELSGLTVCCDHVEGLGEYVEVESNDPGDEDAIKEVLDSLGVGQMATTKTYSELLGL